MERAHNSEENPDQHQYYEAVSKSKDRKIEKENRGNQRDKQISRNLMFQKWKKATVRWAGIEVTPNALTMNEN